MEIPEIPQVPELRNRPETIMFGWLYNADQAFCTTIADTISGAFAALGYYLSAKRGLSVSLDDRRWA